MELIMLPENIEKYCIEHSTKPGEVVREIGDHTRANVHGSNMLIGEMEAAVLTFLIKLGKVKNVLELGTYTGYSALAMAEQLPADGKVVTVDINPHTTKLAREFWDKSPHGKKITQILKPGLDALNELDENFDLIFIDADKNNYSNYLEWSLKHLSTNGFIVVDNTLWSGKVLTPGLDKQTDSIIEHNKLAASLQGYTKVLLPIRDGMFCIQKG
jgi:caffeoyl-CoA O-methyltransferase